MPLPSLASTREQHRFTLLFKGLRYVSLDLPGLEASIADRLQQRQAESAS